MIILIALLVQPGTADAGDRKHRAHMALAACRAEAGAMLEHEISQCDRDGSNDEEARIREQECIAEAAGVHRYRLAKCQRLE